VVKETKNTEIKKNRETKNTQDVTRPINQRQGEMLIDGTDTIANVQTGNLVQPDTTINTYSENYQEFWERLRAEANAAGKDSITYYYEYKKEEFRARNGNEAALPKDMVDAIQYTMLILDVANRNDKLTQEERKTYTITKNKEKNISITGNKDLISNYNRELLNAIVHQARKAGSTESQIQGLLAAMVRNPGSFRISSDFTKAQKKVYVPGTDKKGIYKPPYFYECLAHAGIDITAIDNNNGASGGIHYHIEVTTLVNGKREFVNPVTLERAPEGTRFEYRYGKIEKLYYHYKYIQSEYDYSVFRWGDKDNFDNFEYEKSKDYVIYWTEWFCSNPK